MCMSAQMRSTCAPTPAASPALAPATTAAAMATASRASATATSAGVGPRATFPSAATPATMCAAATKFYAFFFSFAFSYRSWSCCARCSVLARTGCMYCLLLMNGRQILCMDAGHARVSCKHSHWPAAAFAAHSDRASDRKAAQFVCRARHAPRQASAGCQSAAAGPLASSAAAHPATTLEPPLARPSCKRSWSRLAQTIMSRRALGQMTTCMAATTRLGGACRSQPCWALLAGSCSLLRCWEVYSYRDACASAPLERRAVAW